MELKNRLDAYMELRRKAGLATTPDARKEHEFQIQRDPRAAEEAEKLLKGRTK